MSQYLSFFSLTTYIISCSIHHFTCHLVSSLDDKGELAAYYMLTLVKASTSYTLKVYWKTYWNATGLLVLK